MEKNRIKICDIPVDPLTMEETLGRIDNAIKQRKPLHHVVINVAKIIHARKDKNLYDAIQHCDIINADGQGVVLAAKLLKKPLPEKVSGIDLMEELVKLSAEKGYKIFFLGAKEEVVRKVVEKYNFLYGNSIIAGYRNGYFKTEEDFLVAEEISKSGADILFVAITSPKKEIFLKTYKDILQIPFIMGVGGSFDVVSGLVKRAPIWMQNVGLEWLYRTIQEPKRMWKRYLTTNTAFLFLLSKEKAKQLIGIS